MIDVHRKLVPFTRQTKFVPVISLQYVLSFLTHFENLIFCFSFITSPDKHIWRSLQNASLDSFSFCRLWNQHEVFLRNDGGGFNDAPICFKFYNGRFQTLFRKSVKFWNFDKIVGAYFFSSKITSTARIWVDG